MIVCLGESELSRHVNVLGSTGSGKTNVISLIMQQIRDMVSINDTSIVVLDAKGDYLEILR